MDLIELMRASTFSHAFECHKKLQFNGEDYYYCTNENGENGLVKIIGKLGQEKKEISPDDKKGECLDSIVKDSSNMSKPSYSIQTPKGTFCIIPDNNSVNANNSNISNNNSNNSNHIPANFEPEEDNKDILKILNNPENIEENRKVLIEYKEYPNIHTELDDSLYDHVSRKNGKVLNTFLKVYYNRNAYVKIGMPISDKENKKWTKRIFAYVPIEYYDEVIKYDWKAYDIDITKEGNGPKKNKVPFIATKVTVDIIEKDTLDRITTTVNYRLTELIATLSGKIEEERVKRYLSPDYGLVNYRREVMDRYIAQAEEILNITAYSEGKEISFKEKILKYEALKANMNTRIEWIKKGLWTEAENKMLSKFIVLMDYIKEKGDDKYRLFAICKNNVLVCIPSNIFIRTKAEQQSVAIRKKYYLKDSSANESRELNFRSKNMMDRAQEMLMGIGSSDKDNDSDSFKYNE